MVSSARAYRRAIDEVYGQKHVPNHIPSKTRLRYFLSSLVLLGYGALGLYLDDLFVPTRRSGSTTGLHLHGTAALLMYAAMLTAAANMISVVIDHYDMRPNERRYRRFAFWSEIAAWLLAVCAVVVYVLR